MPEILTESFCERCGTRYTFEAAAPKGRRLGKIKVLSKGLVNFVTNDEASLDEAFADARSDQQRELTGHQLEAFHKTFQFCMSCRQYTCANCWNEAEGRCLSCAPHLGQEILEAPFPDLDPTVGLVAAAATDNGHNGHADLADFDASAWPSMDLPVEPEATLEPAVEAAPEPAVEAAIEAAPLTTKLEPTSDVAAPPAPVVETASASQVVAPADADEIDDDVAQAVADADRTRRAAATAATLAAAAAASDARSGDAGPAADEDRIAAAAARTTELLDRFRPGYGDAAGPAEPVIAGDAEATLAAELPAAAADVTDAPLPLPSLSATALAADAAVEEIRRTEVETEADSATEPDAATAQPAVPPPQRDDRVEAPVWQIVAPDSPAAPAPDGPPPVPTPVLAPQPPPPARPSATAAPANGAVNGAPGQAAQWPNPATTPPPQWPMPASQAAPEWPLRPTAVPVVADLWAASSQDVLNRPGSGVQACVSCGLPLSASARFCRRCGSSQH